MPPPTELLAHCSIFATLDPATQSKIARLATCRDYRKGDLLFREGAVFPYLVIVAEGSFSVVKLSTEGRALIVGAVQPGEIFWGLAFFHDDAPMVVSLQADAPSRACLWSRDAILPILLANSHALWELTRVMAQRMIRISELLEGVAFHPVIERVARLLLEQAKEAQGDHLTRTLTLDDMAARTGTTREVVCRTLYRFSEKGLIRINRTEVVLTDRAGLAQIAEQG